MRLTSITFALSAIVAIAQAAPLLPVVDELSGIVGGLTRAAPGGLPNPPVNDVPLSKRVLNELVPDLGILPKPQTPGVPAVPQVPGVPQVPALENIPLLHKRGLLDQLVPNLGRLPQAPGLPALPQTPATPDAAPYHTWDNIPQLVKRAAMDDFKNIVDPTAPVQDPTIIMNPTVPMPPSPFKNIVDPSAPVQDPTIIMNPTVPMPPSPHKRDLGSSVLKTIPVVPLPGGLGLPLPDLNTEGTQVDHTVERRDLASAGADKRVMDDHNRLVREKPQNHRVAKGDDLASAAGVPRVMGGHNRILREKPQNHRVAKRDDLAIAAGVPRVMGGDPKLVRKVQVTKHDLATARGENVMRDRHRLVREKSQHHHRVAQA
ncbi:MAG: hypothetical protein J3Q66DRAFT_420875 [Benniella sp.]|nr:MAG: hypothetical protein J3Q66DRAFT_420875 [Benniella sp.]